MSSSWEPETIKGKNYWVKRLLSGAVIMTEIPPPHTHEPKDSPEMVLLKQIIDGLKESGIIE